jgi:hypothetical protein
MTAAEFRSDPFLRTSGYGLMGWALVNMAFSLPLYAHSFGRPWSPGFEGGYALVLILMGLAAVPIHERRVNKMLGPAGGTSRFAAAPFWIPLLLTGVATSVVLSMAGGPRLIFALWTGLVGLGYSIWGAGLRFREYQALGGTLLSAFVLILALQARAQIAGADQVSSTVAIHLWNATMGLASLVSGIVVNRRYLWLSPA